MSPADRTGPLHGLRVVVVAGIGPGPHACMLLADHGAEVVRVERPGPALDEGFGFRQDAVNRGREVVTADLKSPGERDAVLALVRCADVLVEGFHPGVAEPLGIGRQTCLAGNPRLVYARMTGWGQEGPLAQRAGHDLNYVALTGILDDIGGAGQRPVPPLDLVGDFGGGSMFLVFGVLAALWERERSGVVQVVDVAMVDGASALAQMMWAMRGAGHGRPAGEPTCSTARTRSTSTYACADGRHVAVASLEPQFFDTLLAGLQVTAPGEQWDTATWPALRRLLCEAFADRTRDEWTVVFAETDAWVTPVLTYDEALVDDHLVARGGFCRGSGVDQPMPTPRFSRAVRAEPTEPVHRSLDEVLHRWSAR